MVNIILASAVTLGVLGASYSYSDDTNNYSLTLNNEANFTLTITSKEDSSSEVLEGIYIVNEDGGYDLYVDNELYATATLDDATLTFSLELSKGLIEEALDSIKNFLDSNQYAQYIMYAIQWAINSGLLISLFGVFLKYRKYKSKSSNEISDEVNKSLDTKFKDLSKDLLEENADTILKALDKFSKDVETIKKALVLAQDKTSEGKKALLELLSENNTDELKQVADKVKEKIESEQKANEQIINDFKKEDYVGIEEVNTPID